MALQIIFGIIATIAFFYATSSDDREWCWIVCLLSLVAFLLVRNYEAGLFYVRPAKNFSFLEIYCALTLIATAILGTIIILLNRKKEV